MLSRKVLIKKPEQDDARALSEQNFHFGYMKNRL